MKKIIKDEGARYVGEFAIGVNPYVTKPMKDILFDEKIIYFDDVLIRKDGRLYYQN